MRGRPDRLRLGDVVRFRYQLHTIVGFDGTGALLRAETGETMVVTIAALVADASIEVIRAPIPARDWSRPISSLCPSGCASVPCGCSGM